MNLKQFLGVRSILRVVLHPRYLPVAGLLLMSLTRMGRSLLHWYRASRQGGWSKLASNFMNLLLVVGLVRNTVRDVKQRVVRAMLEHSTRVQRRAVAEFKPDVVVGSSWGGCIATRCLQFRYWNGPTVLLVSRKVGLGLLRLGVCHVRLLAFWSTHR